MSKDIEEIATDEDFVRVAALVEHAHQFNPPACYVHADLFPPLRRIIATAQAALNNESKPVARTGSENPHG